MADNIDVFLTQRRRGMETQGMFYIFSVPLRLCASVFGYVLLFVSAFVAEGATISDGMKWYDGRELPIEGRAFDDTHANNLGMRSLAKAYGRAVKVATSLWLQIPNFAHRQWAKCRRQPIHFIAREWQDREEGSS